MSRGKTAAASAFRSRIVGEGDEAPDQLLANPLNWRVHPKEQVDALEGLLKQVGWVQRVIVNKRTGHVVDGHARVALALRRSEPKVPVLYVDLSEAEERLVLAAIDPIGGMAGRDDDMLAQVLDGLTAEDAGLQALLDDLRPPPAATEGMTDPDDAPPAPIEPVTRPGDVWLLGRHRIVCGDSTKAEDVAKALNGVKPHLMVTDPPYGVEYDPKWRARAGVNKNKKKMGEVLNDDRADWREAWELFPGDVAYVWHASLFTREVLNSLEVCGFKHRSMIIWAKDRFTLGRGDYHWQHEPAWYVVRDGKAGQYVGGRSQSTVWSIPARDDSGVGHGTQKPVECMKRPIENNSSPGQAVYEPFSGSGTTIIACEMTGRSCHALELSPAYVDVNVRRWQAFTGKAATLEGDGRTFDEIAAERVPAEA
jgi:DNA modification methylase